MKELIKAEIETTLDYIEEDLTLQYNMINEKVVNKNKHIKSPKPIIDMIRTMLDDDYWNCEKLEAINELIFYIQQHTEMMERTEEEQEIHINNMADMLNVNLVN